MSEKERNKKKLAGEKVKNKEVKPNKEPDEKPVSTSGEEPSQIPKNSPDKIEDLEKEIEMLKSENLKIRAEYDNFRKRTIKERDQAYNVTIANTFERLLPVIDNFDRAIDMGCNDPAYEEGMDLILAQFHEVLSSFGVKEIDALGKHFDPALHYAVVHEEDGDAEENTIVEVLQKGYTLGDTVLRHAMVKVAN